MARWWWVLVPVLCVAGEATESRSAWSHTLRRHRASRDRSRDTDDWWTRKLSVPETMHSASESSFSLPEMSLSLPETRHSLPETRHSVSETRPSVPETSHEMDGYPTSQMALVWNELMRGTQSDQPQPKQSASRLKHQLGSRPGVNRLRRLGPSRASDNYDIMAADAARESGAEDARMMLELMMEIEANYSCLKPVRQLVSVARVHPSASAIYLPPSVLLRRCSDQTGCCTNERLSCQPAANATVKQPVLVKHLVGDGGESVKFLEFVEHTRCECRERTATARSDECPLNLPADDSDTRGSRKRKSSTKRRSNGKKKSSQTTCQCPTEFASRALPSGRCKCDCFVGNRKCKRIQRGAAFQSETDHRCVSSGACHRPVCRYGKYNKLHGRCPRRKGEFRRSRFVV